MNAGAKAPAGAKRPPSGAPPASERAAGGPTPATDPNRPTFEFGLMPLVPATAGARGAASRAARLLVDGVATPDQMSKDAFLGQLRAAVLAAAGEELAGSSWTAEGCPWIDHWFAYYGARSAEEVEEALLKYAPEARSAVAAEGYVAPAVARVRLAIGRWRKSGEIDAPETPAAPLDAGSPTAVRARLGAGQPLAGDARARMEQGFGRSFADVRVHTGAGAAAAADRLGASAFTVGNSIAFGAGLAPSGGIAGDLLLAHELAHTTQQRGAPGAPAAAPGVDEAGADRAAMTAVARTQGAQLEAPAAPALGGLALRRCNDFTPKTGAPASTGAGASSDTTAAPGPARSIDIPALPDAWVRKNGPDDLFLAASNGHLIALPAANLAYTITFPENPDLPAFFGVPTAGKEGLRVVSIGGRRGVLIDSGGVPEVLMTAALAAVQQQLGVKTLVGINTLHIHEDHIRNFEKFVGDNDISPSGLRFPASFATSSKEFARIIARLRTTTSANLVKMGYGAGEATAFDVWNVPSGRSFFHTTLTEGVDPKDPKTGVTYDEYGLTEPFEKVGNQTAKPTDYDPASTLLRITDNASGTRVLVIGDPRGSDLKALHDAMGDEAFGEIFENVTVLEGFQHHTGVLKKAGDVEGLDMVVREVVSRNGEVTIVEQSSVSGSKPFLNRSLVEAMRQFGVSYKVATEPDAANPATLGQITLQQGGKVAVAGGSIIESEGDPQILARTQRYRELSESIRQLQQNQIFLRKTNGDPIDDVIAQMSAARDALGEALGLQARPGQPARSGLLQALLAGVRRGGDTHGQATLTNQEAVDALKPAVLAEHPGEEPLKQPEFRELIAFLYNHGNMFRSIARNLEIMRKTGEVTPELIKDLIEVNPELARTLLESADLEPEVKLQLEEQIKAGGGGAKYGAGSKAGAGIMIGLQLWNDVIGPGIALLQQGYFEREIQKFFTIINWWLAKGVMPSMDAAEFRAFHRSNIRSQDPNVIRQMISEKHIGYLALTGIYYDANWDRFAIWMDAHVKNVRDYATMIRDKPIDTPALRHDGGEANLETAHWEYRAGVITPGRLYSYDLDEVWHASPQLDTIMQAMARRIRRNTDAELQGAWKERAQTAQPSPDKPGMASPGYRSRRILSGFPPPQRHVRFRTGLGESDRRAYSVAQYSYAVGHVQVVSGDQWLAEPTFLAFDPETAAPFDADDVGPSFLLVTGADTDTFSLLLATTSLRRDSRGEKPREMTFNRDGLVLVHKSSVEDVP